MNYQESMRLLSECGIGALLIDSDSVIVAINRSGEQLLHGEGCLVGQSLRKIAPELCEDGRQFASPAFSEYLLRCPTPEVEGVPEHAQMIVFRNATSDACHDMLMNVLNQISEAVILCDVNSRIWMLNDAAVKMDSIVTQDVLGERVEDVYSMRDDTEMIIPQTIERKRPMLGVRQYYTTRYGKNVDIVSNNYPIVQNGQVLGGFSIMEDWSTVDSLHKQIIDLQEKLVERRDPAKQKTCSALAAKYHFSDIIHISPAMNRVVAKCRQAAKTDSSVMLYGETGTGKELFAQSIHNESTRANRPFLAINCAAIPENLLESMLFGTEKGAYTGAERRPGLFEQADTGTLLLDEINSMNIGLQAKLLRVLQDGVIRRVGGTSEIHVDVRVLSNINIPPYQAMEENKLRRDLFYRLGVVNINVPPLRERREDIALLAKHFIMECNKKLIRNVRNIDQAVLERFHAYSWPGNVRELQHAIEHAMNILPDEVSMITPEYLPEHILSGEQAEATYRQRIQTSLSGSVKDLEYHTICRVLQEQGGNISESARVLQMSRQNLQYRIKRYKIDIPALLHTE